MRTARKVKLSITLSADVVARIDRDANRSGETRSSIIDRWLRRASAAGVAEEVDEATAAYYRALTDAARAEDEGLARASSRASRKLEIDDRPARRRRR